LDITISIHILDKSHTLKMLRRKPTALTVTSEDITQFEEAYLRKIAYARYLKTGEDPEGYFRNGEDGDQNIQSGSKQDANGVLDPNDELKPLPGDKARIVRSREERIVGTGASR
jgi:hypothetical protein